jgi:hypothetical protein
VSNELISIFSVLCNNYNKVFCATTTIKYGVLCKYKTWLWFCAKLAPTYGIMCNFLAQVVNIQKEQQEYPTRWAQKKVT